MEQNCLVCGGRSFTTLFTFDKELAVSSDGRIVPSGFTIIQCNRCTHVQKELTSVLLETISKIYTDYHAYRLGNGEEEMKDISDTNITRSSLIVRNTRAYIGRKKGTLLDIGTGSGAFLKQFCKEYSWELYAQDIFSQYSEFLYEIKGFKHYFDCDLDTIKGYRFDLASAIHVFEHLSDLHGFLLRVKGLLEPDGVLLLQVPDLRQNLHDVFVLDHLSHFSQNTLHSLLIDHFKHVYISREQVDKEITIVASDRDLAVHNEGMCETQEYDFTPIESLLDFIRLAKDPVAVFGSSPIAVFYARLLSDKFLYCVDENFKKVGKKVLGKTIVHPSVVGKEVSVLFPYSHQLYCDLKERLSLNLIYF